ncbi:MAG: hypothetical protein RUMPE_00651 [Eubacteriales bacterium SKADARSKE-1]|nr:hypothetical protein [Eubacteriales bacterium SKADARSKE-1]
MKARKRILSILISLISLISMIKLPCYADSFSLTLSYPTKSEIKKQILLFEDMSKQEYSEDLLSLLQISQLNKIRVFTTTLAYHNNYGTELIWDSINVVGGIDEISDDIRDFLSFFVIINDYNKSYDKVLSAVEKLEMINVPNNPQAVCNFYHANNSQYRHAVIDVLKAFGF